MPRQVISASAADLAYERPSAADDDVAFPESLAHFAIESYTRAGGRVLDPFAGFGTTLVVAQRLGRVGFGLELLSRRVALIRERVTDPSWVVEADAHGLAELKLADFDLCLTSPPYMNAVDHPENPLTGYRTTDGSYARYLRELGDIFTAIANCLTADGTFALNVADVKTDDFVTPLVADLTLAAQRSFVLSERIRIEWDEPPPALVNDCLLVLRPRR